VQARNIRSHRKARRDGKTLSVGASLKDTPKAIATVLALGGGY
jgi:hypothetical protein